jgi:hypothetical protein
MDLNSEGLGSMYGTQGARLPGQDQQPQLPGLSQNTGWGFSTPAPGDPQLVDSRLLEGGENNGGRSLWDQGQVAGLGGVGPGGLQTGNTTKDWVGAGLPANSRPAASLPNTVLENQSSMWPANGIWSGGLPAGSPRCWPVVDTGVQLKELRLFLIRHLTLTPLDKQPAYAYHHWLILVVGGCLKLSDGFADACACGRAVVRPSLPELSCSICMDIAL